MAVQIPAQALADAITGCAAAGYPDLVPVVLAIASPESGFNPGAIGDDGSSFGYTQMHVGGISALYPGPGLGHGHVIADLLNGQYNFRLAASAIGDRLARNGGDLYDALQPWSTRDKAWALLPEIRELVAAGGTGGPNQVPVAQMAPMALLAVLALVAIVVLS